MAYSLIKKERPNGDLKRRWARCRTSQPKPEKAARNYRICSEINAGQRGTLKRLSEEYGISRQRTKEIYDLYRDRDEGEWLSVPALPGSELKIKT